MSSVNQACAKLREMIVDALDPRIDPEIWEGWELFDELYKASKNKDCENLTKEGQQCGTHNIAICEKCKDHLDKVIKGSDKKDDSYSGDSGSTPGQNLKGVNNLKGRTSSGQDTRTKGSDKKELKVCRGCGYLHGCHHISCVIYGDGKDTHKKDYQNVWKDYIKNHWATKWVKE